MTTSLPLKVQGFDFDRNTTEKKNVCICCTSQNDVITEFSSCKHTRFLSNYIKPEIDLKNTYICNICHEMLKTIEVFIRQVEGSISSLLEKVPIHKPHRVTIVGATPTDIDDVKSEIDIASVKSEATDEECLQVEPVETGITLEQVESDMKLDIVENDFELGKVENDITLEQEENDITLEQVNSDIKLEIVENAIELGKVENDITLEQVENDITLEQVENDITLEQVESDIKLEIVENDIELQQVETDIKLKKYFSENEIECKMDLQKQRSEDKRDVIDLQDSSDNDSEPPIKMIKNEYEGKIKIVILTEKQMQEERARMAKNDLYLNLPYKCEDCIVGFKLESHLVSHNEMMHMKMQGGYQCKICKTVFTNKDAYKIHRNIHNKRMVCMICQKRFKDMSYAVLHYNKEHTPAGEVLKRSYACTECSYTTTKPRSFRYHKQKHKEKETCDICGNLYVSKYAVKVHKKTVHIESRQEYKCEQCDKIYLSKSGLENHRRTVHTTTDTQPYCVACKAYFSNAQSLKHHLRTHSRHINETDKRFICDYCGRKFVNKRTLRGHISWEHFRVNVHPCTKCTKVYRNSAALDIHVAFKHNKKKKPRDKICDYCGRGFTSQSILQSHIRTHTGERPLHCSHCPATFAHSAALYNHNRLVHKKKKINK